MKNRIVNGILIVLLIMILLVSAVLFTTLFRYDSSNRQWGQVVPIALVGEYSEEGGPWKPLDRDVFFKNLELRDITVRGVFDKPIPVGTKLFLNIDHMWVSLRVNGEEIYSISPKEGDGNPTKAMGKQWVTVSSPGITTDDTIELQFGNLYRNAYMIQFDELLWQMQIGDAQAMLIRAITLDGWTMGVGAVFLFLTLCLFTAAIGCAGMRMDGVISFLWLGLFALFSSLWFFTLSPAITMLVPLPVFLNVLYAFSMQALATFLILFVKEHMKGWRRQSLKGCVVVLLLLLLIGLVNQVLGIQDLYSAINYFSVFDLIIAVWMVYCIAYEAYIVKRTDALKLLKAMLPLAIAAVGELINGYIQFSKAAILIGLGMIAFIAVEGWYILRLIKQSMDSEKRAILLEQELAKSRIFAMLSQIQPHFLYNALNTIRYLCRTAPERAEEVITDFSKYLRGNMDSLTQEGLIPFAQELDHTKCYLGIEQARFPDIQVLYDLNIQDFFLPPLALQTLVENAIRHGVTQRDGDDGTVMIATWEDADAIYIRVEDDGPGFDTTQQKDDGKPHIGISNTNSRLGAMCGGSLSIESVLGKGTNAIICLPKEN